MDDSPVLRPPAFLRAQWRHIAMLNYEVDPRLLAAPAGTEVDLWKGKALLSMVGFRFLETRVLGIPVPFHGSFVEANLRFYVRREVRGEIRHGVVFVREVVPSPFLAMAARLLYGEPYLAMPTRSEEGTPEPLEGPFQLAYGWKSGAGWNRLEVAVDAGAGSVPPEGSQQRFLTHKFWGYGTGPAGRTVEYAVRHPDWRVWNASAAQLRCDAAGLYGPAFAEALAGPASSATVAEGSEVSVSYRRWLGEAAGPSRSSD